MNRGYIKLFRKTVESGVMQNAEVLQLWVYFLIKATHTSKIVLVGKTAVELEPGQFIFGRKVAANDLNTTERKVRTCLSLLKKIGNVTITATSKFSVVTVVNWGLYQYDDQQDDQQNDQQATNKRPTSDQQATTYKNNKEQLRTLRKDNPWLPVDLFLEFINQRKKNKKPMTERAILMAFNKLNDLREKGHDPAKVIKKTIFNCWKGFFPLKPATDHDPSSPEEVKIAPPKTYQQQQMAGLGKILTAIKRGEKNVGDVFNSTTKLIKNDDSLSGGRTHAGNN